MFENCIKPNTTINDFYLLENYCFFGNCNELGECICNNLISNDNTAMVYKSCSMPEYYNLIIGCISLLLSFFMFYKLFEIKNNVRSNVKTIYTYLIIVEIDLFILSLLLIIFNQTTSSWWFLRGISVLFNALAAGKLISVFFELYKKLENKALNTFLSKLVTIIKLNVFNTPIPFWGCACIRYFLFESNENLFLHNTLFAIILIACVSPAILAIPVVVITSNNLIKLLESITSNVIENGADTSGVYSFINSVKLFKKNFVILGLSSGVITIAWVFLQFFFGQAPFFYITFIGT